MVAISTVPEVVDLTGYAGDTLPVKITVSDQTYTQGCTWSGHVLSSRDATTPDAVWTITPDASGGADAELSGDQTAALTELAPVVLTAMTTEELKPSQRGVNVGTRAAGGFQKYVGVYDIQIERPGFVRTLVQGSLTIEVDVTRLP